MNSLPLVSVICLCHNQQKFVAAAIRSVFSQTYEKIELIVVDDASTDGSQQKIEVALTGADTRFLALDKNIGNCAAFNKGLELANGQFIIDLAADDLLLPQRVEEGINDFANASDKAGVHFSDAFICDSAGTIIATHYARDADGQINESIPEGNIYIDLISRYFICPPTMMIKREVLDELKGYDENLSYEDFDFWIRSSRTYDYLFNPAPLVKKRIVRSSHGQTQRRIFNGHQKSTYRVCRKIYDLNRTPAEYAELIKRCRYEIRQCVMTLNFSLIPKYLKLIASSVGAYRRLSSSSSMEM